MAVFPSPQRLRKMIDQAMRDRAPKFRLQLVNQGRLQQEISDRTEMFHETLEEIWSQGMMELDKKDLAPLKMIGAVNELGSQSVEQALAVVLEFPTTEPRLEA